MDFPLAPPRRTSLARTDAQKGLQKALADCTDKELLRLIDATDEAPEVAPHLIVWFEAALLWEWDRRTGFSHELRLPEVGIPPTESGGSHGAAIAMRETFGRGAPARRAVVDAAVRCLASRGVSVQPKAMASACPVQSKASIGRVQD
jgi:hypothetical protein